MIACSKSITIYIYIRLIVGLALSGVSKVNSVYSIMTYIRKKTVVKNFVICQCLVS